MGYMLPIQPAVNTWKILTRKAVSFAMRNKGCDQIIKIRVKEYHFTLHDHNLPHNLLPIKKLTSQCEIRTL